MRKIAEENSLKIISGTVHKRTVEKAKIFVGIMYPSMSELYREAIKNYIWKYLTGKIEVKKEDKGVKIKVKEKLNEEIVEVQESKLDDYFFLKTKVLGTKEEWLRSKMVIAPVPKRDEGILIKYPIFIDEDIDFEEEVQNLNGLEKDIFT